MCVPGGGVKGVVGVTDALVVVGHSSIHFDSSNLFIVCSSGVSYETTMQQ